MIDDYDHQFSDLCPLVWNITRWPWTYGELQDRVFREMLKDRAFREMVVVGKPFKTCRLKLR